LGNPERYRAEVGQVDPVNPDLQGFEVVPDHLDPDECRWRSPTGSVVDALASGIVRRPAAGREG
jgi:hypothetical protein